MTRVHMHFFYHFLNFELYITVEKLTKQVQFDKESCNMKR